MDTRTGPAKGEGVSVLGAPCRAWGFFPFFALPHHAGAPPRSAEPARYNNANKPLFLPIFMPLSADEVRRIAALARIEASDEDVERARSELSGILGLLEQLRTARIEGIEPMAHASDADGGALRLRDDRVTETDRRSLYQSVAPSIEAGLYLVPKVIE
jgi:aspartyl-tRNA(Asn)/glutamyl-tRNA(Gln) amidotransferase subunit C